MKGISIFQGLMGIWLGIYLYRGASRMALMVILTIIFLTSLFTIYSGIRRKKMVAEFLEIFTYFTFFGVSFLGMNDLKDIVLPHPRPNYFWVPTLVCIIFNWGEWVGKWASRSREE